MMAPSDPVSAPPPHLLLILANNALQQHSEVQLLKDYCSTRVGLSPDILYSGKLSREKTFANFVVLWQIAKVFFRKIWDVASFGVAKQAIRESFLHENCIFH